MTTSQLDPAPSIISRDSPAAASRSSRGHWLFSPWLDALFVANLAWPLFLLLQTGEGFSGRDGLQFWQIYFLTTPHRWITLALVFLDRDRLSERKPAFLALAAASIAACCGTYIATGTLTCLLSIDYIWNAWHFAAQHHGIYRIYDRRAALASLRGLAVEKWVLRLFLLYVILRVAGATWTYTTLDRGLQTADWLAVAAPAWLLFREATKRPRSLPRSLYLISVLSLYLWLLAAVQANRPALVLLLTTASALFHATEYLAIVTWSVHSRHATLAGRLGTLGHLATRWAVALGTFVVILGSAGWLLNEHLMKPWLLANVIVAFLHYAYDGMIWHHRPGVR